MNTHEVQKLRVLIDRGDTEEALWLRVEAALDLGDAVLVAGWSSDPEALNLVVNDPSGTTHRITRSREDVATTLKLEGNMNLGFTFLLERPSTDEIRIAVEGAQGEPILLKLSSGSSASAKLEKFSDRERLEMASFLRPFGEAWTRLVNGTTSRPRREGESRAHVDVAAASSDAGGAVISGWVLRTTPESAIWIESSSGDLKSLSDGFARARQDVLGAFGAEFPSPPTQPGFTIYIPGVAEGDVVLVRAEVEGEVVVLAEATVTPLPRSPTEAAQFVFGLAAPTAHRLGDYVHAIAAPALEGIVRARTTSWDALTSRVRAYGRKVASPKVSVIVPLYGRMDFVEHQLLEFSRDEWFKENAELIYVIDDPRLVDRMIDQSYQLHQIYGVAFSLVWGDVNRGYSGANNLGASYAMGDQLLFLNSDAFPQSPGWLEDLSGEMDDPSIGVIAPRLLFADGSIQHAGMAFRYRGDLRIWVNHHPNMGLDPALDPAGVQLTDMPAVTGACLLVRRDDFDRVEGWDTGYLIGDFEDSDLCLKIRELGKRVVYNPKVQLTHLERQSFAMMGESDFRFRVVIYNAVRHQRRWGAVLEEVSTNE